jgi:predicted MPP superfamily phosphohydrolase
MSAAAATLPLAWGWFEAGWLRRQRLEIVVPGLDGALAGLRVLHLSDFHLGMRSRGERAVERAVDWAVSTDSDLIVVTGDLISRPVGEAMLKALLQKLDAPTYAVLGNHDVQHSRDPFSRSAGLLDLSPARLLVDESETIELRGRRVQIVGVDPRSFGQGRSHPEALADPAADLRILLCHFPRVLDSNSLHDFQLVLAGHMHDGQIAVPYLTGKLRLAHLGAPYTAGVYERPGTVMHVSPGLGTTLVPLRFFARPEATELVLQNRLSGDDLHRHPRQVRRGRRKRSRGR